MIIYKLRFKPSDTTTEATEAQAKRLATGYIGKEVIFRGKNRKIASARFNPTRGFVLTDDKGKTFLYADILDTRVARETPSEPETHKEKKPKAKPTQDVADFRVRLERSVIREACRLTCHDAELHISDPLLVAYLARLGLRELRQRGSRNDK